MRGRPVLLVLALALAGCASAPADDVDPAADPTPGPATASPTPASTPGETPPGPPDDADPDPADPSSDPQPSHGNASGPAPDAVAPGWPDLAEARIRPGVQVYYPTAEGRSQCTSNFVFTSPDNRTLWLGVAAHCFGPDARAGDPVIIGDDVATGVLEYSSWLAMGSDGGDPTTGANPTCSAEEDQTACDYNDFALVRIDPAARGLVHPAMLHYGGPTGLAPQGDVRVLDKVLTYGHSGLRQGIDPTNRHEGYVLERPNAWTTTTYTAVQGVPGDSGSGVLLGDGRAFGVLVTVHLYPTAGANGVTSLDQALAYAKAAAGIDARLATWELLTPGILPS